MTPTYEPNLVEVLDELVRLSVPATGVTGITGVKAAYGKDAPRSLAAANMPCVIYLPGPSQPDWPREESDEVWLELYITRTIYAVLFVAPHNAGADGEYFSEASVYMDRFWDFALIHHELSQIGGVKMSITGDTGVRNDLVYAGQRATGIRFELAVISRKKVQHD